MHIPIKYISMLNVILLISFIQSFDCIADNSYMFIPTFEAGKSWVYHYVPYMDMSQESYLLVSATNVVEFNNQNCYTLSYAECDKDGNILQEYDWTGFGYDDNGKVFYSSENMMGNFILAIDYNLKINDNVFSGISDDTYVTNVDYVEVDGIYRKRIEFPTEIRQRKTTSYWVEGIGTLYNIFASPDFPAISYPYYYEFEKCIQDNKCIFSKEDFSNPGNTGGTEYFSTQSIESDIIYNIHGVPTDVIIPGSVYIRNGM